MAGHHQQGDDAYANENDGADDRRNARDIVAVAGLPGVTLGLEGIPLRAPRGPLLLAIDAPLGARIIRGRRTAPGRRVGRECRYRWPLD